jgi:subtilisin family serine protease
MKNKTLLLSLIAAIIVVSCTSPSATDTAAPSIIPPTPTRTAIPTNAYSALHTQIAETQTAKLIESYQASPAQDLTRLNRTLGESVIETLWFTQSTKWWSTQDQRIAQNILKLGMNPGLGVRELQAEGITGKGVTVAIIDQPVVLDHPEFQGKIVKYYDTGTAEFADRGSMHGPAVTSLLVGENIGTAPDAKVYYVAAPSWLEDAQYYADALDWIVAENEKLPEGSKIRVVSVSTMPSGMPLTNERQRRVFSSWIVPTSRGSRSLVPST